MIWKCIILGMFLMLCVHAISAASDLRKADELFDKGTFQEALKVYESVYKETANSQIREKAFFRICESLAHLFRYGEAAQKLLSTEVPRQLPQHARFLILKAEIFRNFLMQYSYLQRGDEIDEDGKEVFRLTPNETRAEIRKAYIQLWELRNELAQMDMKNEGYFLDIQSIDFGMYPTLFDYLIFSWTDFLLRTEASYVVENAVRPGAELLLVEKFKCSVDLSDLPALLAAELIEEASRFGGMTRLEASERWKIRRLLLPLRYSNLFDLKNLAEDKTVYDGKDLLACRDHTKAILFRWMDVFETREAKAEAGYEITMILNTENRPVEVVKLCERIERTLPGTYASGHAQALRSQIQMPTLYLTAKTVLPPAQGAFTITTKNLKKVYFRIYRINPEKLKNEYVSFRKEEYGSSYDSFDGWSGVLNLNWSYQDWGKKLLKSYLLGKTLYKEWSTQTGGKGDYETLTKTIDPPALEAGIYLVFVCGDRSFKIGSSLLSACFLNVTDLVLLGTAGFTTKALDAYYDVVDNHGPQQITDDAFHFYALSAKTGKPPETVNLDVNTYLSNIQTKREFFELKTDKEGFASLPLPVVISPLAHNYYYADPLAQKDGSFAYWRQKQNLNYYPPGPLVLFIETDRPIYKPGDKVQAKVVVVRRTPQGFRTLDKMRKVTFLARDPNAKEFFSETVELSEFGSASVSFEIPGGRLLGRYSLNVSCQDGRFNNNASIFFSVEEYKQPEFEIEFKTAEEPWKYGQPVEIKGEVTYYFGGPVPDAIVTYHIKRQTYVPYCYRWSFGESYSSSAYEVATGQTKTDSKGNFVIPFTPEAVPGSYAGYVPVISQFSVEVTARDAGGRTIEAQQSYKAGKNAIYLVIEPEKGFYLENQSIGLESRRLTINDVPAQGTSSYQVFSLKDTTTKSLSDIGYGHYGGYWGWTPPLDGQLKDVPNEKLFAQGKIKHNKDGKGIIRIRSLPQGVYRIVEKTLDKWGEEVTQNKIFVVAKDTRTSVPINAASVTLVEKDEYKIGEVARFVIGSGLASGIYHIELWAGDHLLGHQLLSGNQPVRLIEVPVTGRMKGGFTLRWFGVKDFDVHYGQATVLVPWNEKKIKVSLKPFNKELKPDQEYSWGVRLPDARGWPIRGEVLALMYDRSLEYYVKSNNLWLDDLYALRTTPIYWQYSVFNPNVYNLPITEGLLEKLLKAFRQPSNEPKLPRLRTWETWANGDYRGAHGGGGRKLLKEEVGFAYDGYVSDADAISSVSEKKDKSGFEHQEAGAGIKTRRKFADTAFFKPHIVTDILGHGRFSFVAPEQLTSWRIKVFAFTKDVKEGTLTEEVVTKKELIVRADLPRFFREKDKGTITAVVHNESEHPLEGELSIDISEDSKSINQKLKLQDNKKGFTIQPHGLASFNWMIEIPQGISTYKVHLTATADRLSDAEERDLPILPSRQRLVESAFVTLSGSQSKRLEISLKDDPTRINESMVLQIDPQVALSILNTIPFLIDYPYECVEQILNKYVPLSIMNEIYKKYPAIGRAVSKIPHRKTPSPAWEKDDPSRLLALMETPWVWESEGRPTIWPIIDLLDPEIVKAQKEITFNKLRSAQLANGAFPWWPGGEPDPYMTLYVLSGLAQARHYGVEVPTDIIQKALEYVNEKIPPRLKPEERDLALVSFAAYVVTSYSPKEYSEAKKGHEAAGSWVIFLERHIHALTPLGKAYLAYTYLHLGNRTKAESVLDLAMDGAREDPIAGVYWTPEKYSWVWYSDDVEKHAFFLRTLQELRPQDKRIPGMVQWLLFNRKGTVWKSTKASAAAVYALLDYLDRRGALASNETFKVKWGNNVYSQVLKADDWIDQPIRWQERGFEITPEKSSAQVQKEGPGIAFASLTWTYSTDELPQASQPGMLELERKFYRRIKEGNAYHLKPIRSGERVSVGDQIEVQLKINTRSQFEYMHLKDPKAAGFESEALLSGWKRDPLWFYEEPRSSITNFFISWLPHGEYILRYRLRPTKPGVYRIGAATLQSMYSPDMTAHSAGFVIKVIE